MANKVDTRLLMAAAQVARQWQKSEVGKEWIRNDFAKFAKPRWMERGGQKLIDYMMEKYVNNDEQSIVEYLYNLDHHNKEIVVEWLLSKVKGDSKERRDCISGGGLTMTEFNEGWWNCFCSFANELANVSSNADMVIRAVLDGAGVTKKEIDDIIKSQHLDKRVIEELKEYRAKLRG